MAEQLDIFGGSAPLDALPTGTREVQQGARGGSVDAAKIPDKPERYVDVLRVLRRHTHADFELQRALPGVNPGTVSKRRLRLEQTGLCERVAGVSRKTPDGVDAMVFTITNRGKEVLEAWEQQT